MVGEDQDSIGSVQTDSDGSFLLRSWRPGRFYLKIERIGYQTVDTDPIALDRAERVEIVLELQRDPVALQPIVIRSRSQPTLTEIALQGFNERRSWGERLGMGRYLDRAEIESLPAGTLLEIARNLPGIRVEQHPTCAGQWVITAGRSIPSIRSMRGRLKEDCEPGEDVPTLCPVKLFINGAPFKVDWSTSMEVAIPTSVLTAVEVYRSPSELPAEFGGADARCGVVSIWTGGGG